MNAGAMELPIYSYVKFETMNVNFSCNDKLVRKITANQSTGLQRASLYSDNLFEGNHQSKWYVGMDYFTQKDTQNKSLEISTRM